MFVRQPNLTQRLNLASPTVSYAKVWALIWFPPCLGTYIHQAAGIALHPHEWRNAKQRNSTPPANRQKNYPYTDGGFSEDDWDKPTG